jgi:arylsulfatase A-like enzyme
MRMRLFSRVVLILARAMLPAALFASAVATAADKPNVIVFLMDDLGWRDLHCTGSTFYETPNIDRLASRGVLFTRSYAAAPICSPTRASIITGLYPGRIGLTLPWSHHKIEVLDAHVQGRAYSADEAKKNTTQLVRGGPPNQKALQVVTATRLSTKYPSIARLFKSNGYRTAHFGKWHLGPAPYSAIDHGFDIQVPQLNSAGPPRPGHFGAWPEWVGESGPENKGRHVDDRLAERAIAFIREHGSQPFYMNFWAYGVHVPLQARRDLIDYFAAKADPKSDQRNPLYAAMIKHTDEAIGRVWSAVEEAGLSDKTVVVFLSDNGGVTVGGGRLPNPDDKLFTSNLPLRGEKGDIYEGGVRVPGFVIWPGVGRTGATSEVSFSTIDVLPTVAEICGLQGMPKVDGRSVAAAVAGKPLPERPVFMHYPHYGNWNTGGAPATTVVAEGWKLIRFFFDGPGQKHRFELYHLAADPGESIDLSRREPGQVEQMDRLIDNFLRETGAVLPQPNPAYRPPASSVFDHIAYQLFTPEDPKRTTFPLVVCLGGEAPATAGGPARENRAFEDLQRTIVQFRHPSYLLSVEPPAGRPWVKWKPGQTASDVAAEAPSDVAKVVHSLLEKLLKEHPIDPRRIYITGEGVAATAAWHMAVQNRSRFAAAVLLGETGSPSVANQAGALPLPVWAFDWEGHEIVSAAGSRRTTAAPAPAGATSANYTVYKRDEEAMLDQVWQKRELTDWLFGQLREVSR